MHIVHICSLGLQGIREEVTLQRVISSFRVNSSMETHPNVMERAPSTSRPRTVLANPCWLFYISYFLYKLRSQLQEKNLPNLFSKHIFDDDIFFHFFI